MCRNVCWIIGIVAGVIALWVAMEPVSLIAALLLGVAVAAFVGLVLNSLFCRASPVAKSAAIVSDQDVGVAKAAADAKAKADADQADADAKAVAEADKVRLDAEKKAGEQAAVKRAADAKIADADAAAAVKAKAKVKTAPKTVAAVEEAGQGSKPEGLSGPRDGKADDLKQIKGIGPKLEILCNEMGFYHFDQIAAWGADEVAYMNLNLKGFKGRVSRDTWVEQATLLATGGETEFSKRVEKGSVYNK